MSQALRGLAWNAFAAGTDIESKISILYASPAAWSHGLLWGADTFEVPRDDASFSPSAELVHPTAWPEASVAASRAVRLLLRHPQGRARGQGRPGPARRGVNGYIAEEPFTSTTGGPMPAGTLIFAASAKPAPARSLGSPGPTWPPPSTRQARPLEWRSSAGRRDAPRHARQRSSQSRHAGVQRPESRGQQRRLGGVPEHPVRLRRPVCADHHRGELLENRRPTRWPVSASSAHRGRFPGTVYIAASPSGATETGNTVTTTTSTAHNLAVGATVTIAGVPVAGYNGTVVATAVDSTTAFEYTDATAGLAASGGGTVAYKRRSSV